MNLQDVTELVYYKRVDDAKDPQPFQQPGPPIAITDSGWVFFDGGYSCPLSRWEDYQDGNLAAADVALIEPLGRADLVRRLAGDLTVEDKQEMKRHWPERTTLELPNSLGALRGPDIRSLEKARSIQLQVMAREQAKTDAARIDAANAPVHDANKHRGGFYDV